MVHTMDQHSNQMKAKWRPICTDWERLHLTGKKYLETLMHAIQVLDGSSTSKINEKAIHASHSARLALNALKALHSQFKQIRDRAFNQLDNPSIANPSHGPRSQHLIRCPKQSRFIEMLTNELLFKKQLIHALSMEIGSNLLQSYITLWKIQPCIQSDLWSFFRQLK